MRMSVMFLLTRVALEEKRELRPVAIVLLKILTVDAGGQSVLSDSTEELRCVAFRSLVDLLVRYSWEDFLLNGKETPQELSHPSLSGKWYSTKSTEPVLSQLTAPTCFSRFSVCKSKMNSSCLCAFL